MIGSILCGAAICGMHYLGNSSIKNYTCIYRPAFIVGAAIIAVFASIIALSLFFVFRGVWAHSWWKRSLSAFILAGAVSGMHWCAVVGTRYRLVNIQTKNNEPSRIATVIVVICLVSVSKLKDKMWLISLVTWCLSHPCRLRRSSCPEDEEVGPPSSANHIGHCNL